MDKLINHSKLLRNIDKAVVLSGKFDEILLQKKGAFEVIGQIRAEPPVDAVEVVRCRDCEYFMQYTKEYAEEAFGDGDCRIATISGAEDQYCFRFGHDYCSYGERRSE